MTLLLYVGKVSDGIFLRLEIGRGWCRVRARVRAPSRVCKGRTTYVETCLSGKLRSIDEAFRWVKEYFKLTYSRTLALFEELYERYSMFFSWARKIIDSISKIFEEARQYRTRKCQLDRRRGTILRFLLEPEAEPRMHIVETCKGLGRRRGTILDYC